jgi:hypothetical protein
MSLTTEVQNITVSAASNLGGFFTISYDDSTYDYTNNLNTSQLPYDATAAQIKAALENISSITSVNVSRVAASANHISWLVTFTGDVGNLNAMTATSSLSGSNPMVVIYADGVQGGSVQGDSSSGTADGTGTNARFKFPRGVALDSSGNLVVADSGNHAIRKVSTSGVVTTLAGYKGLAGGVDGTGTEARFNEPYSVAVDPQDNVYVADVQNHAIRMVTPAGAVTTVAGATGPPEIQAFSTSVKEVSEVQSIMTTAAEVHEVQMLSTYVTEVNEIQMITTTADPRVSEVQTVAMTAEDNREIQKITTSSTLRNEIQVVSTSGSTVNEVQVVQTDVKEAQEIQNIRTTSTSVHEQQTIETSLPSVPEVQVVQTAVSLMNARQRISTSIHDIDEVQVVQTSGTRTNEVQSIQLSASSGTATGTFLLGGATISANSSATDFAAALSGLGSFGTVTATRGAFASGGYTWDVTFTTYLGDVPPLSTDSQNIQGQGISISVQELTKGESITGTFNISLGSAQPVAVAHDATAEVLDEVLELMTTCGSVDVSRSGPDTAGGYKWSVTFVSTQNPGDVDLLTATSGLAGSGASVVVCGDGSTEGVCTGDSVQGNTLGGSFYLSYGDFVKPIPGSLNVTLNSRIVFCNGDFVADIMPGAYIKIGEEIHRVHPVDRFDSGQITLTRHYGGQTENFKSALRRETTSALAWNASAADIEVELESLYGIGDVNVTRKQVGHHGSYNWTVTFIGNPGTVEMVNATYIPSLTGLSSAVSVKKLVNGTTKKEIVSITTNATHRDEVQTFEIGTIPEIQRISTSAADAIAGSFKLQYEGESTAYISFDATAADMKSLLEDLSTIGRINCDREGPGVNNEYNWTVTFLAGANKGDIPNIAVKQLAMTGTDVAVNVAAVRHGEALGGSFTLSLNTTSDCDGGVCTRAVSSSIPFNATTDQFKAAIESMDNAGTVVVSRNATDMQGGYVWSVTFITALGNLPELQIDENNLVGLSAAPKLQNIANGNMIGGSFKLSVNQYQTSAISYFATAAEMQQKIAALPNVIDGVTVSRTVATPEVMGYTWTITFDTNPGDLSDLVADVSDLTGDGNSVVLTEVVKGTPQLSGTFTLDHEGYVTEPIAFDATASDVKSKLEALVSVNTVLVDRSENDGDGGFTWSVTFAQNFGDLNMLVASNAGLIGASPQVTVTEKIKGSLAAGNDEVQRIVTTSAHVDEVQVVVTDATRINEVQQIKTSATDIDEIQTIQTTANSQIVGGTFRLQYKGETTDRIGFDASASGVAYTLGLLTSIPSVTVTRSESDANKGYTWTITFSSDDTLGDVDQLTTSDLQLSTISNDGSAAVSIATTQNGNGVGGSFTLSVCKFATALPGTVSVTQGLPTVTTTESSLNALARGDYLKIGAEIFTVHATNAFTASKIPVNKAVFGLSQSGLTAYKCAYQTSPVLPYNATAAEMESALQSLAVVRNVTVLRSDHYSNAGYDWNVTFVDAAAHGDIPLVVVNAASLTGIGVAATVTTLTEGNSVGGSFTLQLDTSDQPGGARYSTQPLMYDSSAATVKEYLESLPNIGTVNVTRTGPSAVNGYRWIVTFRTDVGNIPQLTVPYGAPWLSGLGKSAIVSTLTQGNSVTGHFRLKMAGEESQAIKYDASANEVALALDAMSTVGNVVVTRSEGTDVSGYTWDVTFQSTQLVGNVPELTSNTTGLMGTDTSLTISSLIQGTKLGGYFTVGYGGYLSAPIAFDASATTMKNRLEAMKSVGTVTVKRSAANNHAGFRWLVIFESNHGDLELMTADSKLLDGPSGARSVKVVETVKGTTVPAVQQVSTTAQSTQEVQSVTTSGSGLGGTFTLTLQGQTTTNIAHDAPAATMEAALEAMGTIGNVTVTRSPAGSGFEWMVTFECCGHPTHNGNVPELTVNDALLTGSSPAAAVATVTTGTVRIAGTFQLSLCDMRTPASAETIGTASVITGSPVITTSSDLTSRISRGDPILVGSESFTVSSDLATAFDATTVTLDSNVRSKSTGASAVKRCVWSTTDPLNFDASAADVKSAIEKINTIGVVQVSRGSVNAQGGYDWLVTFTAQDGRVPLMTSNFTSLTSPNATVSVSEYTAGHSVMDGTFTLSFDKHVSAPLPFDISASSLEATLDAFPNIGNVSVSSTGPDYDGLSSWRITFTGYNIGKLFPLVVDSSNLLGTNSKVTACTHESTFGGIVTIVGGDRDGEQVYAICDGTTVTGEQPLGGSFKLGFGGETTTTIPYDVSDDALAMALQRLSTGTVAVTSKNVGRQFRKTWRITFTDYQSANKVRPYPLVVKETALTGINATVFVCVDGSTDAGCDGSSVAGNLLGGTFSLGYGDVNVQLPGVVNVVQGSSVTTTTSDLTQMISRGDKIMINGFAFSVSTSGTFDALSLPLDAPYTGDTAVGLHAYKRPTTVAIPHNATSAYVKASLETLPSVGTVNVHRSEPAGDQSHSWSITFVSNSGDLNPLVANAHLLTGTGGAVSVAETFSGNAASEVQVILTTATANDIAGAFKVSLSNATHTATTADVATDASANTLRTSLIALGTDFAGDIAVSRTPKENGFAWSVTFLSLAGDLKQMVAHTSTGWAGSNASISVAESVKGTTRLGSTFALSMKGQQTANLTHNASAMEVQSALMALQTVSNVSVSRDAEDGHGGYTWSVTFLGDKDAGDLPLLTADGSALSGPGAGVAVSEVQPGSDPLGGTFTLFFKKKLPGWVSITKGSPTVVTRFSLLSELARGSDVMIDSQTYKVNASGTFDATSFPLNAPIASTSSAAQFAYKYETIEIAHNATADEFKSALESSSLVNNITVVATKSEARARNWEITFRSDDNVGNLPLMSVDYSSLLGGSAAVTVSETVAGNSLGGTFTLSYDGAIVSGIPYDASAAEMKTWIQKLSTIEGVDVTRSKPDLQEGYQWTVIFTSNYGNITNLKADIRVRDAYLEALDAPSSERGILEVQTITTSATKKTEEVQVIRTAASQANLGGNFTVLYCDLTDTLPGTFNVTRGSRQVFTSLDQTSRLVPGERLKIADQIFVLDASVDVSASSFTITSAFQGPTNPAVSAHQCTWSETSPLTHDASALTMEAALESLAAVGNVTVTRTPELPYGGMWHGGHAWTVTFHANVASNTDVPLMKVDASQLTGASAVATVTELVTGTYPIEGTFTIAYGKSNNTVPGTVGVTNGSATVTTSQDVRSVLARGDRVQINNDTYIVDLLEPFNNEKFSLSTPYTGSSQAGLTITRQFKTVPLPRNANTTQVKEAMEALPTVGLVDVSRNEVDTEQGYSWNITFTSSVDHDHHFGLTTGDIEMVHVNGDQLLGSSVTSVPVETIKGQVALLGQNVNIKVEETTRGTRRDEVQTVATSCINLIEEVQLVTTENQLAASQGNLNGSFTLSVCDFDIALPGVVAVTQNHNIVETSVDLTGILRRGDQIKIGTEAFFLSNETEFAFNSQQVPLSEKYLDSTRTNLTMFRCTYHETGDIAHDATPQDLQAALEALAPVGSINVTRGLEMWHGGFTWSITFHHGGSPSHVGDQPQLIANHSKLSTPNPEFTPTHGPNSYVVEKKRGSSPLGGAFTLLFCDLTVQVADVTVNVTQDSASVATTGNLSKHLSAGDTIRINREVFTIDAMTTSEITLNVPYSQVGQTEVPIYMCNLRETREMTHDVSAFDMEDAITRLSNIGRVHVTRSEKGILNNYTWTVTYTSKAGDLQLLRHNMTLLIGTQKVITSVEKVRGSTPLGGTFAVEYEGAKSKQIVYDAHPAAMKSALEAMSTIETVDVSRIGPDGNQGFTWFVTFTGLRNACGKDSLGCIHSTNIGNLSLMSGDTSLITANSAAIRVEEVVSGSEVLGGTFTLSYDDLLGYNGGALPAGVASVRMGSKIVNTSLDHSKNNDVLMSGTINLFKDSSTVFTTHDLTEEIFRGDTLVIEDKTYTVHLTDPFDATHLPLDRVWTDQYRSEARQVLIYRRTRDVDPSDRIVINETVYEVESVTNQSLVLAQPYMGADADRLTLHKRQTTVPLSSNASIEQVKVALENLTTIGFVNVEKEFVRQHGMRVWHITFANNPKYTPHGSGDMRPLVANGTGLTGRAATIAQKDVLDGSLPFAGTYRLSYSDYGPLGLRKRTTNNIAWDASATEVQVALQALSSIGTVITERSTGGLIDTPLSGTVSLSQDSSNVRTTADLTGEVLRGDTLVIRGQQFTVHATDKFDLENLPLTTAWSDGSSSGVKIYKRTIFADKGRYSGRATDPLPGTVDVVSGSRNIKTSVDLTGNLTRGQKLVIGGNVYDVHSRETFNATTVPLHKAYVGVSRTGVKAYKHHSVGFTWKVTFTSNVGDLMMLTSDLSGLVGADAATGHAEVFSGIPAPFGIADGVGSIARFNQPHHVVIDPNGNLYVADYGNHAIRKINPSREVSTVAGLKSSPGLIDGYGWEARFRNPSGVALDALGNLYVADEGNSAIRLIGPERVVTTLVGFKTHSGYVDGTGTNARFNAPSALGLAAASDELFISDAGNHKIRKMSVGVPEVKVTVKQTPDMQTVPSNLTFTHYNWYTAQTIVVSAVNDNIAELAQVVSLTHTSSSVSNATGGLFDGLYDASNALRYWTGDTIAYSDSVNSTVHDDNDTAGIIFSRAYATVREGGETQTYTVVLSSDPDISHSTNEPANRVTVFISGANTQMTVSPSSLTFTGNNWHTPQTVEVAAIDDEYDESADGGEVQAHPIAHYVSSGSPFFNSGVIRVSPTSARSGAIFMPGGSAAHYITKASMYNFPTTAITISFWMKSSKMTDIQFNYIVSYASTEHDNELTISYQADGISERFAIGIAQRPQDSPTIFSTKHLNLINGNWHHIAVSWRSADGLLSFYTDGQLRGTSYIRSLYTLVRGGTLVLGQDQDKVGGGFDAQQSYTGELDEIRLWKVERSAANIASELRGIIEYESAGSTSAADLISYWRFDDGAGMIAKDLGQYNNHFTIVTDITASYYVYWSEGVFTNVEVAVVDDDAVGVLFSKSDVTTTEGDVSQQYSVVLNSLPVDQTHKVLLGASEATAGLTCADILRSCVQSETVCASGAYWITAGLQNPFQVFCDMDTDGGGWTIVASYFGGYTVEEPLVSDVEKVAAFDSNIVNTNADGSPLLFEHHNLNQTKKAAISASSSESLFKTYTGKWVKVSDAMFGTANELLTASSKGFVTSSVISGDGTNGTATMGWSNYGYANGGDFGLIDGSFDLAADDSMMLNTGCANHYIYSYSNDGAGKSGYDAGQAFGDFPQTSACEAGAGGSLRFYAAMRSVPVAIVPAPRVTIAIATTEPTTQMQVSHENLVFTNLNWNLTQTVSNVAVNDYLAEKSEVITVRHAATSNDPLYDGQTVPFSYSEQQLVNMSAKVVNEIQTISTAVDVINEQQIITSYTAANNEQQTIETSIPAVDEVQYITTSAVDLDEIQVVRIAAANTSANVAGTFTLSFGVDSTIPLSHAITASDLRAALQQNISAVGSVAVSRTGPSAVGGFSWSVTFLTLPGDIQLLQADGSGLNGTDVTTSVTQKQAGNEISGGVFELTCSGSSTGSIMHNATDASVQSALSAIAGLAGATTVTRSSRDAQGGYTWSVTFTSGKGDIPPLTLKSSTLTGVSTAVEITEVVPGILYNGNDEVKVLSSSATPINEVQTITTSATHINEVQTVTITADHIDEVQTITTSATDVDEIQSVRVLANSSMAGTFKLTFNGVTTAALPYNVDSTTLKARMEKLANVGSVSVSRTTRGFGFEWLVTFTSELPRGNLPLMQITPSLSGANVTAAVLPVQDGSALSGSFKLAFGAFSIALPGWVSIDYDSSTVYTTHDLTDHLTRGDSIMIGSVVYVVRAENTFNATRVPLTSKYSGQSASGLRAYKQHSTPLIPYNASASMMKAALEALATIEEVSVSRITSTLDVEGYQWIVSFTKQVGDMSTISANSVQTLQGRFPKTAVATLTDGNALGGYFHISYQNETTDKLMYDTSAAEVKDALQNLSTVGDVTVVRTGPDGSNGYVWTVTFVDNFNNLDCSDFVANGTQLTGIGNTMFITETVKGTELGGTFILLMGAESTSPLAHNIDAAALRFAIESEITAAGSVNVSRTEADSVDGYTWTVNFASFGDIPAFTVQDSLSGAGHAVQVNEYTKGNQLDGTFSLSIGQSSTSNIPYDVNATELGGKLSELPGLTADALQITRSSVDGQRGYSWSITFLLYDGDVPNIVVDSSAISGIGKQVVMSELTKGNTLNGSFAIIYGAHTTTPIPYNASANAVKLALQSLPSVGSVAVDRTMINNHGLFTWRVQFMTNAGDLPFMTVDATNLGGCTSSVAVTETVKGNTTREVQTLTTTGAMVTSTIQEIQTVTDDNLGGTFNLTIGSNTTTNLAFDADSATVKAALEALPSIPVGSLAVNKTSGVGGAATWLVTFQKDLGNIPEMAVQSSLTGTSSNVTTRVVQDGVSYANPLGGVFTITYQDVNDNIATTTDLPHDATAQQVEDALIALYNLGTVQVSRIGPDYNDAFTWSVTFLTEGGNLFLMRVNATRLTGTSAAIRVTQTVAGSPMVDGSFTLSLRGGTTGPIPHNATTSEMREALEASSSIDSVAVSRSGHDGNGGYKWTVTFVGAAVVGDIPLLTADTTNLKGVGTSVTINEATPGSPLLAGSLSVEFRNKSAQFQYNASATDVQRALEGLATVGSVKVSQTTVGLHGARTWAVTFIKNLNSVPSGSDELPMMVVDGALLTGENPTVSVKETVQGSVKLGGTFSLSFQGIDTSALPFNVQPSAMRSALEEIASTGTEVLVTRQDPVGTVDAYCWTVTFTTNSGDLPLLVANTSQLQGTSASVTVSQYVQGLTPRTPEVQVFSTQSTFQYEIQRVTMTADSALSGFFNLAFEREYSQLLTAEVNGASRGNRYVTTTKDPRLVLTRGDRIQIGSSRFSSPRYFRQRESFTIPTNGTFDGNTIPLDVPYVGICKTGYENTYDCSSNAAKLKLWKQEQTTDLPFDASCAEMKRALENLDAVSFIDVSRTGPHANQGYVWDITFITETGDQANLQPNTTKLEGNASSIVVTEVQHGLPVLTGSFTLTMTGADGSSQSTANLDKNVTAGDMQAALQGLTNVNQLDVGRQRNGDTGGYNWTIKYMGDEGDVNSLSPNPNLLTGSEVQAEVTETIKGVSDPPGSHDVNVSVLDEDLAVVQLSKAQLQIQEGGPTQSYNIVLGSEPYETKLGLLGEVQEISLTSTAAISSGTFTLSFGGQQTTDLTRFENPSNVKTALEALSTVGTVLVSRSVANNGYVWTVTFTSNGSPSNIGDLPNLQATHNLVSAGLITLTVSETRAGTSHNRTTFVGDGSDGAISVTSEKNMNADVLAAGRNYADGVAARVVAPTDGDNFVRRYNLTDNLLEGFAINDWVLLINVQTADPYKAGVSNDVGVYQLMRLRNVTQDTVFFTKPLQHSFNGLASSSQVVVLQRVPQYTDVTVTAAGTLTAGAWNGLMTKPRSTGIVAFFAKGQVVVDGSVHADGKGYRGGQEVGQAYGGFQGESTYGLGIQLREGWVGAGGGGGTDEAAVINHLKVCVPEGGGKLEAGVTGAGGSHVSVGLSRMCSVVVQLVLHTETVRR